MINDNKFISLLVYKHAVYMLECLRQIKRACPLRRSKKNEKGGGGCCTVCGLQSCTFLLLQYLSHRPLRTRDRRRPREQLRRPPPHYSAQSTFKKDPGRARQNSLATVGTNFTKPGAHNKGDFCTRFAKCIRMAMEASNNVTLEPRLSSGMLHNILGDKLPHTVGFLSVF